MHTSQGDVLLPLSTLKRTVCPAVSTVADVVRLRGTAVKLSAEGGQATNNFPTFFHTKQRKSWKPAGVLHRRVSSIFA